MRRRLALTALALAALLVGPIGPAIGPTAAAAQARAVPTPESVLGFPVGADYQLADYEESIAYFQALAAASDRVQLLEVGRTSEGKPWTLAVISSPENLAKLEEWRANAQRLEHPSRLTEDQARQLAAVTPAFVDISGGLHASEVAGAQHCIALAHRLAAGQDAETLRILDDVVLFLWPSLNPDGQDIVVHWYRENVGTPYETSPLHELYQRYVGHDNNRDAYMLNTVENRVVERTWRHWAPQLIHVHHQSSPFPTRIWLPPFAEPIAPRVPARMSREANTIGMAIAQRLETEGKPGATHMGTGFDAWYPGYIDYMPMLQNTVAFWTETAGYSYGSPAYYTLRDFPADKRDLRAESLYPSPWKGGWWRLADAVDYMVTASMADLDWASKYRTELLMNKYRAGREAMDRYRAEPPFAYLVPRDQRDPMAAVALLRRLAFNGIRVEQLDRAAELDGERWPAGTWVIPMDQEFGELARQVLEVQDYPDLRQFPGGPPERPYDAAGWTLPYQMGVRVVEAEVPLPQAFREAARPVRGDPVSWREIPGAPFATDSVAAGIVPAAGRVTGSGRLLAVDPSQNEAFSLINRVLADGGSVQFADGRYLLDGASDAAVREWTTTRGLTASRTGADGTPVRLRAALYRPFTASMDEGWSRWLFDQYGFRVDTVTNADFHAGGLVDRYDVIVLPSARPSSLMNGYAEGTVPPRYAGGIGEEGVRALDAFVRAGGTLVAMGQATELAMEQLDLPVRNAATDLGRSELYVDGSILRVRTDPSHPVTAGMPDDAYVFFDGGPILEPDDDFAGTVLASYPETGSALASGYLLGEEHLRGRAAALDVEHGAGHVILLAFRPQWRGQPFGTFRVLFNTLFYAPGM